jgi:TonB family protein
MNALKTGLIGAVALLAAVSGAAAQVPAPSLSTPSLAAARTLYASAEYGGALDMLNGLLSDNLAVPDRQAIDLYRALCLVAVGNTAEANRIIDAMVTDDPLYRPASDDVPPRLRSAFTDARRRLLPAIVQQGYVAAKAAFDKKDYPAAAKGFTQVLAALNDPDLEAASGQPPLADLKMLATGFSDLALKAIAPPPPPPAPAPAPAPAPVVENPTPRVYSPSDGNVVPPVTVRQAVPPFPGRVLVGATMMVEVIIDETGAVESANMEGQANQGYDRLVLGAAKTWQYQPATLNGKPVKYRKRIQLSLVPTPR